jgi:hypothetical protein
MTNDLVNWLFGSATSDAAELKDALVALASVAGVVWTGALVIRQISKTSSSWRLIGAMDLLQNSFVTAVLALGLPTIGFRSAALILLPLYLISYGFTLRTFDAAFRAKQSQAYQKAFAAMDQGRDVYIWSIILFFAGALTIIALPSRGTAFGVTFLWFFVGFQLTLSAFHAAKFSA